MIDPVRGNEYEFHIDAGLRIRGGYSRSKDNPKHSLRLFFRSEYGEGKLRFPLFDDEGASEFDKVDLRTSQNYSWSYVRSDYPYAPDRMTFIREVFSRDSQRDMGMPYTRSRYYHLYINGIYWGIYQTQERGDADYAATYMGGEKEDWDVIKTSHPGYVTDVSDGTFDAFNTLHAIAVGQGFTGSNAANYQRVKGLNLDGTPNPDYPVYLDEDNLINYMLTAWYTGDPDSPIAVGGTRPNNMYGLFNRTTPDGFKWLRHDAEHSMASRTSHPLNANTTGMGKTLTAQEHFNPATLHHRLLEHPEYRMRFADLAWKHVVREGGALTPVMAQARVRSRMAELDLAVIGESARWGRGNDGKGRTRDGQWLPACTDLVESYLAQRRDIFMGQLRSGGWYPGAEPPLFSVHNDYVRISADEPFYYTLDGSDPRLPGGGIRSDAVQAQIRSVPLISRGAVWQYFDQGSMPSPIAGKRWFEQSYSGASSWSTGPAILGFAGAAPANPVATQTKRYVTGSSGAQVNTTYFRHTFTYSGNTGIENPVLKFSVLRDDGVIVYLNGKELFRDNMPSGSYSYSTYASAVVDNADQTTYFTHTIDPEGGLLRTGENLLAVELHQCNAGSSDLYFDLSLDLAAPGGIYSADIPTRDEFTVLGRVYSDGIWSPLADYTVTQERPPVDYTALRVSKLMYAPPKPGAAEAPYVDDDFAWIELRNVGAPALNLQGVQFTEGIIHTFESCLLASGQRVILAKNPAAFALRHTLPEGVAIIAWDSGNLARKGETLALTDPGGENILTFTYSETWYPETKNTGRVLVALDLAAAEPLWSTAAQWRPSHGDTVVPGAPDLLKPVITGIGGVQEDGAFTLSTAGLEGQVSVWYSTNLFDWYPCQTDAFQRDGDRIHINTAHPSLGDGRRCFFRIRVTD